MARRFTAVLDTNVVLDVLEPRLPWFDDSAAVLAGAESGRIKGMIAADAVPTLFCLLAKQTTNDLARTRIDDLLRILDVAPVDKEVLAQALLLPYADLEDAVQMAAADRVGADYVVSRDVALYRPGPLPVVSPAELLALLNG